MEDMVLDSVTFIGNVDFSLVLRMFFYVYLFFWVMVVIWVWFDASERSSNLLFKIFSVIVTLLFNIFGLLIYLLVRPSDSYEERYLSELEKKYLQLETSGLIKCPKCSFDLEPGFVVCPRCGESVKVKCESCEMYIDAWWEFCAFCGAEREVPESFQKLQMVVEDEEEAVSKRKMIAFSIKEYLCRIGEKQNRVFEKVVTFLKDLSTKKDKVKKRKIKKSKPGNKRKVARRRSKSKNKK